MPQKELDDKTGELARQISDLLKPLELDNPISPVLGTGFSGTGMMAAVFGAKLDFSNPGNYGVVCEYVPLEKAVDNDIPNPLNTEPIKKVKEQIDSLHLLGEGLPVLQSVLVI